jgi:hypothetical protein
VVAETLSPDLCGWRTSRPATWKRQWADGLRSFNFFFLHEFGVIGCFQLILF